MTSDWTIRPFVEEDAPSVVAIWNMGLPYDRITVEQLLQLCALPHCDPAGVLVAESNGDIVGFLPAIVNRNEPDAKVGWILGLVIRLGHESSGIGEALIQAAMAFFKSKGEQVIQVANCNEFQFFPHLDSRHSSSLALLEKMGFQRYRELVDVSKSLVSWQMPKWISEAERCLMAEGISFVYCDPIYRPRFLTFIQDNFSTRWYQHNKNYVERNGDPRTKILALRTGEVVGFVNFVVSDTEGRIRQTGVLPALWGKKIGSILVFKALEHMQAQGATFVSILSCPLGFYRIVEGEVTRTRIHLAALAI